MSQFNIHPATTHLKGERQMPRDMARIAQAIDKIESAFADVGYPGDDQMLNPD